MKKLFLFGLSSVLVACGTSSKKLIVLPPLAADAPVQMFYSAPNLKYESVCHIEAKRETLSGGFVKEDFEEMLKKEARKCGADGVIFSSLSYSQTAGWAYATGIKLTSQTAGIQDENSIKAFSIAIQTKDLARLKELMAKIPKKAADRAPSDDELVNSGLYIATLEGLSCDAKIVNLLENEYAGFVPKFKAVDFFSVQKPDSNAPLCRGVMARSFPRMTDKTTAIVTINNYYVGMLNQSYESNINEKAAQYTKLLTVAAQTIAETCKTSSADPVCATKSAYIDFAKKSASSKAPAVRKNSAQILAILK